MTTRKTKIPQIPQIPKDASPEVRAFLSALKEQVEVKAGQRGNTLDRNLTLRDFTDPELMAQLNIDLTPIIIPGPGGSGGSGGKIVLEIGPSKIEMSEAGIRITGPRIDLN